MDRPDPRRDTADDDRTPRREPTTAILPDLSDLLDRRIDPHRWSERDRRTLPAWAQPDDGHGERDGEPVGDVPSSPTIRFDRGREGFAAVIARPLGLALTMAIPALVMGTLALVLPTLFSVVGVSAVSATMLVLTAVHVFGMTVARAIGHLAWANVWLVHVVLASVVIPLLGLQAILGGVPFTALALRSGGPFLVTSLALAGCLVLVLGMVAAVSRAEPESAALVFLPVGLAVPALLGLLPGTVSAGITTIIGLSSLATGAVTVVTVLLPRGLWLVVPQVALVLELVLFLVTGSGPRAVETTGRIVPAGYGAVLLVTVVASVVAPLLARWLAHAAGEGTRSRGRR
ncbi:MAG: hypothetical protein H0U40_05265 [Chloroflexia bacterium]|nr:hypothetical protein [Chloroflexia bacterium]MDQ3513023.1 hypothetical protein [Chloroflexota bacterium]